MHLFPCQNNSELQQKSINPSTVETYVTGFDSVSEIDDECTITNIISLENFPGRIPFNPHINMVYVAESNSISVIDPYLDKIVHQIPNDGALDIAMNPKTDAVYVANAGSGSVSIIDSMINTEVATIQVGEFPSSIAVNPDKNLVYVVDSESEMVCVIDSKINSIVTGITFNVNPPDSGRITCGQVTVILIP